MAIEHHEKKLSIEDANEILALKDDDISSTLIKSYFGRQPDGSDPRFRTNDYFRLPVDRFNTKKEVWTTIGIYIANLFIIQPKFGELLGYINKPFTGKVVDTISNKLANLLYTDKIKSDDMADFYNRVQWLGGNKCMTLIAPSMTSALLCEPEEIIKRRDQLFKQYAEELKETNPNCAIVSARIEKELVKMAEEFISQQDGADNFDAKSKINVHNNYKNMSICKGATKNSYTGGYRINKSNYNGGIAKEEYSSFADASVFGAYMRAINTAKGGYMTKEVNQAMNQVRALEKGSDCGTKRTLRVFLYPSNKYHYLYRYIMDKGNLTELTPDNWDKYENTWVEMRSPLYCTAAEPCYCNICIGNQPYMLNLENFGLAVSRVPNKMVTISMKSFHDASVKTSEIPLNDLFVFN